VSLGTSSDTYTEIKPPDGSACLPTCETVKASDTSQMGIDIIDSEGSLSELSTNELFYNTFGMNMEAYKQDVIDLKIVSANYANTTDNANPGVENALNRFVYVDASGGTADGDIEVFGCTGANLDTNNDPDSCSNLSPGVLIVEGDLEIKDEATFFGLIFVTGDLEISDNAEIQGALVVAGDITQSGGSLNIYYDSSLLSQVVTSGPKSGAPGTWRDFD